MLAGEPTPGPTPDRSRLLALCGACLAGEDRDVGAGVLTMGAEGGEAAGVAGLVLALP